MSTLGYWVWWTMLLSSGLCGDAPSPSAPSIKNWLLITALLSCFLWLLWFNRSRVSVLFLKLVSTISTFLPILLSVKAVHSINCDFPSPIFVLVTRKTLDRDPSSWCRTFLRNCLNVSCSLFDCLSSNRVFRFKGLPIRLSDPISLKLTSLSKFAGVFTLMSMTSRNMIKTRQIPKLAKAAKPETNAVLEETGYEEGAPLTICRIELPVIKC